jgi:hypothetical protein
MDERRQALAAGLELDAELAQLAAGALVSLEVDEAEDVTLVVATDEVVEGADDVTGLVATDEHA